VYSVKECYFTLQGEGAQVGRAAVFLRFAGCNLWNGLERARSQAICNFCDTDFIGVDGVGGGRFYTAVELAKHALSFWPADRRNSPYIVCTGGEPLLQLDAELISELKNTGFEVAIETNGTILAPDGIDWICVSPKSDAPLMQLAGSELKLVFPQKSAMPAKFEALEFSHFFLQPMDGADLAKNTELAIEYCKKNPIWRLSIQTHKLIGIP